MKRIDENLDSLTVLADHLLKTKRDSKILKIQEVHDIFFKTK